MDKNRVVIAGNMLYGPFTEQEAGTFILVWSCTIPGLSIFPLHYAPVTSEQVEYNCTALHGLN